MTQIHVNKYNGWLQRDVEGIHVKQLHSKPNCYLTTFLRLNSMSFMTKHHGLSVQYEYIKLYTLAATLPVFFE